MPQNPKLTARPATGYSLDALAEIATRGYADYVVPVQFDGAMMARRLVVESIDAGLSTVFVDEKEAPLGIMLIARRGDVSRVAAIGFDKSVRGQGHGQRAVRQAIDAARARGDRRMLLEVIDTNAPAIRAYENCGFRTWRKLAGFEYASTGPAAAVDGYATQGPAAALPVLAAALPADMEWQIALPSLVVATAPMQGFVREDGRAAALFVASPRGNRLMSIGTVPGARHTGLGKALVAALTATYPGNWQVPAVAPADLSPFFTACGWTRGELGQLEMALDLAG